MKKLYEAVPAREELPPIGVDVIIIPDDGGDWYKDKAMTSWEKRVTDYSWLREVGSSVSTADITHDELIAELDDRRVAKAISEDAWYFCRKQSAEHLLEKYEIKPRITAKEKGK